MTHREREECYRTYAKKKIRRMVIFVILVNYGIYNANQKDQGDHHQTEGKMWGFYIISYQTDTLNTE